MVAERGLWPEKGAFLSDSYIPKISCWDIANGKIMDYFLS
jgi:hypothetical protein